jgi:nucleoside phosphorylase
MPRAVILTALSVEYLAVRAHLDELREEVHSQGTVYERGRFLAEGQCWDVGIVEVGPGNPGSAVEAERAIAYFSPDVIFFVGVAGGIKDVRIGDVVAATEVYSYEFGKAGETFQTRPKSRDADYGLEQRARAEARKGDWLKRLAKVSDPAPRVFVGPIAAGEKVIASRQSEVFQLLRSHYEDAIAVEMEGFGFLSAVRGHKQVDAIVIRGISDLIDGKAEADGEGSQEIAACHASAFTFQMLSKLGEKSVSGKGEWPNGATIAKSDNDKAKSTGKPEAPPRSSIPMLPPKSVQEMNLDSVSPKVFISYSHDSQEHKDRVLELADRLREDGIDCTIDQYEESPSEGWQRWMLNRVEEATFVLVACTEQYDRRFCGREAAGKGKGATWEGGVIIQELYDDQGQNAKFIPITLTPEDANFIPSPLRGATSYRLNTDDGYELLYRRLTNQHRTRKPELGKLQTLAPRDRKQVFQDMPTMSKNPQQRQRLEQRQETLQAEWNLRSDKLNQLRQALAIESGVSVSFQLKQEILNEEKHLALLEHELNSLEQSLQASEYNVEESTKVSRKKSNNDVNEEIFSSTHDEYKINIGNSNTNFFGGIHNHGK